MPTAGALLGSGVRKSHNNSRRIGGIFEEYRVRTAPGWQGQSPRGHNPAFDNAVARVGTESIAPLSTSLVRFCGTGAARRARLGAAEDKINLAG